MRTWFVEGEALEGMGIVLTRPLRLFGKVRVVVTKAIPLEVPSLCADNKELSLPR